MKRKSIKRKLIMGLLALGTLGGFASGFCSLHYGHHRRRHAFKQHVTDICAEALERAAHKQSPAASNP